MVVTLEPYSDSDAGFRLLVPREWMRVDAAASEVRLVAVEPQNQQGFRANVVVTVDELPAGLSLGEWQDGNDDLMATMVDAWQLLDRSTELRQQESGHPEVVVRRLGHHTVNGSAAVTMRQLAVIDGSRGYTLTTSIWSPGYPDILPLVSKIEASFAVGAAADWSGT